MRENGGQCPREVRAAPRYSSEGLSSCCSLSVRGESIEDWPGSPAYLALLSISTHLAFACAVLFAGTVLPSSSVSILLILPCVAETSLSSGVA